MNISQIQWFLFRFTGITVLILLTLIIGYYWYSARVAHSHTNDEAPQFRYFLQKQVDTHGHVVGYECRLRRRNNDDTWSLVTDGRSLPLRQLINLLGSVTKFLPRTPLTISFNLQYSQIIAPDFFFFIRWAIAEIAPLTVCIEMDAPQHLTTFQRWLLRHRIHQARKFGFQFCIDHIDPSPENFQSLEWLLTDIDVIKCSVHDLSQHTTPRQAKSTLQLLNQHAILHEINLILIHLDNHQDVLLSQQLPTRILQDHHLSDPISFLHQPATHQSPDTPFDPVPANQHTDQFFAPGHWRLKLWQTFLTLLCWGLMFIPITLTVISFLASYHTIRPRFWVSSVQVVQLQFITTVLLCTFIIISMFTVTMTLIQNQKRRRLTKKWPTYDPIAQLKRRQLLNQFMTRRFGDRPFRESSHFYLVKPNQNLATNEIPRLYSRHHLNQLKQ